MLLFGGGAELEISSHLSRIAVAKVDRYFPVLPAGKQAAPPSPSPTPSLKGHKDSQQRTLIALLIIITRHVAFYASDIEPITGSRKAFIALKTRAGEMDITRPG